MRHKEVSTVGTLAPQRGTYCRHTMRHKGHRCGAFKDNQFNWPFDSSSIPRCGTLVAIAWSDFLFLEFSKLCTLLSFRTSDAQQSFQIKKKKGPEHFLLSLKFCKELYLHFTLKNNFQKIGIQFCLNVS